MNPTKLSKFKLFITNSLIFLVVLENIFFFELVNFFASLVLLLGWLLVKTIVLTDKNMKFYPVSFLMLLMLALFHYVLPIPLTILEWKPVTYNMNMPYETFAHHLYFILAIVFTHKLYANIHFPNNVFRSVLKKTTFYSLTTDRQIWISAIFGIIALFYIYFVYGQWQSEVSDRTLVYYIAALFSQFVWMPLIIPFYKLRNIQSKKKSLKYIIIYSFLVGIIALASNMRTLLFSGVMIIVFLFLIGILFNYYNLKNFITTKKVLVISILILLISGPLTDLAYTMVIVRNDRYSLTTSEFVEKTISVYQDKEGLNKMKNIVMSEGPKTTFKIRTWDEDYLDNILLNRFCNLKISDNCIYFAEKIGYSNSKMQNELFNQITAFMPNALLSLFNIDFSKKIEYSSYSLTDYLYSIATNDPNVRGSFVLGSMPGLGMAIFGYWYLLIIIPIFIIIFSMFDSFVKIVRGRIFFSYFFFVMILTIVNYFNNRHVFTFEIRYIFRTYLESIIVFLILMKIIRGIDIILFKKKQPFLK